MTDVKPWAAKASKETCADAASAAAAVVEKGWEEDDTPMYIFPLPLLLLLGHWPELYAARAFCVITFRCSATLDRTVNLPAPAEHVDARLVGTSGEGSVNAGLELKDLIWVCMLMFCAPNANAGGNAAAGAPPQPCAVGKDSEARELPWAPTALLTAAEISAAIGQHRHAPCPPWDD